MAHAQNEMSSTSTSSIVGPASPADGEESVERGDEGELREEGHTDPIQTITIVKHTHLGIVPKGN